MREKNKWPLLGGTLVTISGISVCVRYGSLLSLRSTVKLLVDTLIYISKQAHHIHVEMIYCMVQYRQYSFSFPLSAISPVPCNSFFISTAIMCHLGKLPSNSE